MRFALERVTGPESEVITLAEARLHLDCFSDQTDDNTEIEGLIVAAREWVEDFTGRCLMDQTWKLTVDQTGILLPSESARFIWASRIGEVMLRKAPVLAIVSVVTVDSDGAETAVDTADYLLREPDSKWPRLVPTSLATWTGSDLRITFRAGYADTTGSPQQTVAEVPYRFKQAMKLWIKANYHTTDAGDMETLIKAAENLIRPERVELGFA
ncbi:MAG: hypothetical protein V4669_13695 [Pseudomonadota bacterium]